VERVLLIEDNREIRAMLKDWLEHAGFDVDAVPDGGAGFDALKKARADVVVTDLFMPGMEGIETIAALRRRHPETKIVAISGGSSFRPGKSDLLAVARAIGADAALKKPFDPDALVAVIRRVLG